jgi:hypothetical protein
MWANPTREVVDEAGREVVDELANLTRRASRALARHSCNTVNRAAL